MPGTIAAAILPEFDQEIAATRRVLERLPDTLTSWKPHPKSTSAGDLAAHLCNLVGWTTVTLQGTELDMNPPGGPAWTPPQYPGLAKNLAAFDANVAQARATVSATSDADFDVAWSLKNGGVTLFSMPRATVIRTFVLNHLIHHRAQLGVYLRMNDIAVPAIYGPSADEGGM